jgi:hypothetical protein
MKETGFFLKIIPLPGSGCNHHRRPLASNFLPVAPQASWQIVKETFSIATTPPGRRVACEHTPTPTLPIKGEGVKGYRRNCKNAYQQRTLQGIAVSDFIPSPFTGEGQGVGEMTEG